MAKGDAAAWANRAKAGVMKAKKVAKTGAKSAAKEGRSKLGTVAHQNAYKRKGWAKRLVFFQRKAKTSGGLLKRDLIRNKRGVVVSRRKSALGKRRYHENHLDLWVKSLLEVRAERSVSGFLLCKKTGTKAERDLFKSTSTRWEQEKRDRMLQMVEKMDSRSRRTLLMRLSDAPDPVAPVKEERRLFKQGDRVILRERTPGVSREGRVGVVERYQLGRWCINFQGDLKSVKPEEIERVE